MLIIVGISLNLMMHIQGGTILLNIEKYYVMNLPKKFQITFNYSINPNDF